MRYLASEHYFPFLIPPRLLWYIDKIVMPSVFIRVTVKVVEMFKTKAKLFLRNFPPDLYQAFNHSL